MKTAGRDACVIVLNPSVGRAFVLFYTISSCVTGPTTQHNLFRGLKIIPT